MTSSISSNGAIWRQGTSIAILVLSLAVLGGALVPATRNEVDQMVQKVMQCAKIQGLGLSLFAKNDKSMYVHGYGQANPSSNERVTTDTRFCIGEATQAFTAVLLAKILEKNTNFTWDTPINDILRESRRVVLPEAYMTKEITLKDILTQRSGLPDMDIVHLATPYTQSELKTNLRYLKPVAGFREKFIPNQVLFAMLEDVISTLGYGSWDKAVKEYILKPLKMNSVVSLGNAYMKDITNFATPLIFYNDKAHPIELDSLSGLGLVEESSSLCLSTIDMSKWLQFVLEQWAPGEQILKRESLRETFRGVQSRGYSKDPKVSGYRQPKVQKTYARDQNALGWINGQYQGYDFISQDGSIPGFQTLTTIIPEKDVAVSVSFTGNTGSYGHAAKVLLNMYGLDIMMGEVPWFDKFNVCNMLREYSLLHPPTMTGAHRNVVRLAKYKGAHPLDDYIGHYYNFGYDYVSVTYNKTIDDNLMMEYGRAEYAMKPTNQNNTFQLLATGWLWFTTNGDNFQDNRLIAVFGYGEDNDSGRPFSTVTISGFDKYHDVIFSINPVEPVIAHAGEKEKPNGGTSLTYLVSSYVMCVVLSVLNFSR